jgi:formylglycine-generating enzyme required for sulfatase activity
MSLTVRSWPLSQDYNEAVQSPVTNFADADLRSGEAATNAFGVPMPCSGNFADVYQIRCPDGSRWAVKCFTREVPGLRERYAEISRHLRGAQLGFTVNFSYLQEGIRVAGTWFPVLKMEWVEGLMLNQFVAKYADKPGTLEALFKVWARMARHLRKSGAAHGDLQHGNILLVPGANANSLALKLVDYDGMFVPSLAGSPSGEVGHAAYQHPQRQRAGTYSLEVDRFPVLLVATALSALKVGGRALWDKYNNGDNLLFTQEDLEAPSKSRLFYELLKLDDPAAHALAERLIEAARQPLEETPLLEDVLSSGQPSPVAAGWEEAAPPPVLAAQATAAATPVPVESPGADYSGGLRHRRNVLLWVAVGGAVGLLALVAIVVALIAKSGGDDSRKGQPLARGDSTAGAREGPVPARGDNAGDARRGQVQYPAPGDGAANPKRPEPLPKEFKNSLGIEFVLVPKGKSWLGGGVWSGGGTSKPGDKEVEIPHDFYLGKYLVTQEEWQKVMGNNPSSFSRGGERGGVVQGISDEELKRFPVEKVSWNDAQALLAEVNKRTNESGWVYRLPKSAEWEYACRGGPMSDKANSAFDFYFDKPSTQLRPEQAHFHRPGVDRTCKVGSFPPNPLGLYDMHGNVWEWCDDSQPNRAPLRIMRGGSWTADPEGCSAANYPDYEPAGRDHGLGLRLARFPIDKGDK